VQRTKRRRLPEYDEEAEAREIEGPMSSTNPQDNLTPAEIENLNELEAVAQHGLETYVEVGNALAEIRDRHLYRDSHPSFETYARERWGVNISDGDPLPGTDIPADTRATPAAERQTGTAPNNKPCEALARACEETLASLADDDRRAIEVRLAVRRQGKPGALADGRSWDPWEVAEAIGDDLLPTLRWLLTHATGTIGRVAHQLEHRAADIDDVARAQLKDDVLVLDDELATLKALLLDLIDWDSEFERLLKGELPPLDSDRDPDDE
jgi:hypothetical protein